MASTYVNDLRLNEMATGDASGSWGTVTNTNLELIGEAFSYGTETIGDADSTLTIADGASDPVRSFFLKDHLKRGSHNNSHRYACTKYCQQSMDD
jgi:Cu2+-containing amine oxidase